MNRPPPRPPIALAMEWVAKITTVALEMVIPLAVGSYLDRRWGTSYLTIAGVVIGMTVGLWHLIQMTSNKAPRDK